MRAVDHLIARALGGDADYVRAAPDEDPALIGDRNMFGAGIAHAAFYGGHPELLALLALTSPGNSSTRVPTRPIAATSGPHAGQTAADTALSQGHLVLAARLDTPGQPAR